MSVYKLIENNNPILTIPLSGVSEDADREQIKNDLVETMESLQGIGLSGNQVGIMERVFVMYENFEKRETIACFNPKITYESDEKVFMTEGCLSYPGLWLNIKRPFWIEVEYENENKEQIKNKFISSLLSTE